MQQWGHLPGRPWSNKFRDAFRGLKLGVRGQSSFFVHFFMAAAVLAAGWVLGLDRLWEWCVLLLCITVVLTAEMFNTAMESMARAFTDEMNAELGKALDIGSAAVLISAIGAAVVGSVVFLGRLGTLLQWW